MRIYLWHKLRILTFNILITTLLGMCGTVSAAEPQGSPAPANGGAEAAKPSAVVRVIVDEQYEGDEGAAVELLRKAPIVLFDAVGLKTVGPTATEFGSTLKVIVKGKVECPESPAPYGSAGATVEGELTLEVNGAPPLSMRFKGRKAPGDVIFNPWSVSTAERYVDKPQERALEGSEFIGSLAHMISQVWGKNELDLLLAALESKDGSVQRAAAVALSRLGQPAIPQLQRGLESGKEGVVCQAAWGLSLMGDAGLPKLLDAARSKDRAVRRFAVRALGWNHSPRAEGAALEALKDSDETVRMMACLALGDLHASSAALPLTTLLKDKSDRVRISAVEALGYLGKSGIPGLKVALSDDSLGFRILAVAGLERIKDPDTVPALVLALKDQDDEVRFLAMGALVDVADARVADAIVEKLGNPKLWSMASKALEHIGPAASDAVVAALKNKDLNVRERAAFVLAKIGDERALPALRDLAKEHPDDRDGFAARAAIEQILARRKAI